MNLMSKCEIVVVCLTLFLICFLAEYIFTELCISIRQWTIENDWGGSRLTKGHCHFDIEEDTELTLTRCTFDQSVLGVSIFHTVRGSRETWYFSTPIHPFNHTL